MDRRTFLTTGIGLGIVSLATGIPPRWLRDGFPSAFAGQPRLATPLILSMSQEGDPVNASAPGSTLDNIRRPDDPDFALSQMTFGTQTVTAGAVWGTLPASLRSRMAFVHHRTLEVAHNGFDRVALLQDKIGSRTGPGTESLPSAIAQETAVALGALQESPVCLGPEVVPFDGARLTTVPPSSIVSLFANQSSVLDDLRPLRQKVLDGIYGDLRANGTRAQRAFLDEIATSRELARSLGESLGSLLADFDLDSDGDGPRDQIKVAVALASQRVAPVITINIPFGADNHVDPQFGDEIEGTEKGVAHIADLWSRLGDLGIQDSVTFGMLNVFGRTLDRSNGRDHHPEHNVMWMAGPNVRGGVVGGLDVSQKARGFDLTTGEASDSGVPANETLPVTGATLMAAAGVSDARISARMPGIGTITAALEG